jgi:hypothetical protein
MPGTALYTNNDRNIFVKTISVRYMQKLENLDFM